MAYTAEFIWLIILLFLSGFFSAAEVALVSLSRLRLKHLLDKKVKGALLIKKLKDEPQRLLTTILVGNNVVNVAAAALATDIALKIFASNGVAIATGVMTFLLLVFGEIVPKSFATRYTDKMALFFAPFIWTLSIILMPIIKLFHYILVGLDKLLGSRSKEPVITEEELKSIVQLGKEEGAIKETERSMIQGVFDIDKTTVEETMTHKKDMVMVNLKATVKDVFPTFIKRSFSRLPVYERSRDHVVGVLFVKDLLTCLKENKLNTPITEFIRKPMFVPEAKKLDSLLRLFQKNKEHMAVVVDEHGSISGLITLEDVLEEIVGEIMDETDREESPIIKIGEHAWLVKGKTTIEELNEKLSFEAVETEADTLNGLIQEKTGKIPKEGDSVEHKKFRITVDRMEHHHVSLAQISKKK